MNEKSNTSSKSFVCAEIDSALVMRAEEILASLGLSSAAAITQFYQQIVLRRGIPFDLTLPKYYAGRLRHAN